MALHLWLVVTRHPGADGGNGTVVMHGYGMFERVDVILTTGGAGMVRLSQTRIPQAGTGLRVGSEWGESSVRVM